MSRIGRLPISLPKNVTVDVKPGNEIVVKGPMGQLQQTLNPDMTINLESGVVTVSRPSDGRIHRMQHGLTRALLSNMVTGVSTGFKKDLEIQGVGYRAEMKGSKLVLFMGYSHPVEMDAPQGISYLVDTKAGKISVAGIDKELVGLTAARIRRVRPPEPYHGKGIRYAGEVVRRKQGKTGK
ncbi:MAG: 50S ribosomal protein L6 [Caldilineales bacterium]